jgi:hypothetical protein
VLAPDVDNRGPVRDSKSFMARLDADFLRHAWEGHPEQMRHVASVVRKHEALDGVRLRYAGFFDALAGRLDGGFSFEDVDIAVLSIPATDQPDDAMGRSHGAHGLRQLLHEPQATGTRVLPASGTRTASPWPPSIWPLPKLPP